MLISGSYNMAAALAQWNETGKGPMAMPHHLNHIAWVRLAEDATPFSKDGFADPIGDMPNSPHIELIPLQISSHPPPVTIKLPPVPNGQ
jgi:choline dehydrogenase